MEGVNDNPIVIVNDKRQVRFILAILAFTLLMAFGSVYYTMGVHSTVTDIGVVRELEAIKYNQQLYLALVAHSDSLQARIDSTQSELKRITQARMDTAARNRADYVRIQHRTDSIIAYETMTRALDKKIRDIQIDELKRKELWH